MPSLASGRRGGRLRRRPQQGRCNCGGRPSGTPAASRQPESVGDKCAWALVPLVSWCVSGKRTEMQRRGLNAHHTRMRTSELNQEHRRRKTADSVSRARGELRSGGSTCQRRRLRRPPSPTGNGNAEVARDTLDSRHTRARPLVKSAPRGRRRCRRCTWLWRSWKYGGGGRWLSARPRPKTARSGPCPVIMLMRAAASSAKAVNDPHGSQVTPPGESDVGVGALA